MTAEEEKAIKWMKSVKDNAVVTLDHIKKNEPNVSPMLYAGRKEKAETIIKGFEELEQYRAIGTVEEIKRVQKYSALAKKHTTIGKVIDSCAEYEDIGTVEECREAREKQTKKNPNIWGDGYDNEGKMIYDMYDCPNCGKSYEIDYSDYDYCPNCGQAFDRSDIPK